jgi:hypothetical protein
MCTLHAFCLFHACVSCTCCFSCMCIYLTRVSFHACAFALHVFFFLHAHLLSACFFSCQFYFSHVMIFSRTGSAPNITSNNWIIFYWLIAYFLWSFVVFLRKNSCCFFKSFIVFIKFLTIVIFNNHTNITCLVSREVIVAYCSLVIMIYMLQIVLVPGRYNNILCNLSFLLRPIPTSR